MWRGPPQAQSRTCPQPSEREEDTMHSGFAPNSTRTVTFAKQYREGQRRAVRRARGTTR